MSYEQYISRISKVSDVELDRVFDPVDGFNVPETNGLDIYFWNVKDAAEAVEMMSEGGRYHDIAPYIRLVKDGDSVALVWKSELIAHWYNSDEMADAIGIVICSEGRDLDDQGYHYVSEELLDAALRCADYASDDQGLSEIEDLEGDDFLITYDCWF